MSVLQHLALLQKINPFEGDVKARAHALVETCDELSVGRTPRTVFGVCTALISTMWLGWAYPSVWIVLNCLNAFVVFPHIIERYVRPNMDERPKTAIAWAIIAIGLGGVLFAGVWAPSFLLGSTVAVYLGAIWFCGVWLHGATYAARAPHGVAASVLPATLAMLIVPFYMSLPIYMPLMMGFFTTMMVANALISAKDRNALMQSAADSEEARRTAEETSLAKSQFLAMMSHELRTPLNAVIGYSEILEEDLNAEGRKEGATDAARIRRAARDLLGLINEVLDFSKIEAGRMEVQLTEADVPAAIRTAIDTVRPMAEANNNKLTLDIAGDVGVFLTDEGKLNQCLLNLLSNAAKFTQDGKIAVRAMIERPEEGEVLRIDVVDTGCGIAKEQGEILFQPFMQLDGSLTRKHGGTGLGLVITRRLAQLLGGDVSFESKAGRGSTFTLRVAVRRVGGVLPVVNNGAATVLVIEDEAAARDLIRRALSRLPFQIRAAATAGEGLILAETFKPSLIVLDIYLPDLSGWELLAQLKADADTRDIPILVVSVDDDRARALALGACDHLVKPVARDQLASAVMRYCRREIAVEPQAPTASSAEAAA